MLTPERSIALPMATLHYTDCGRGAPLVFIHGVFVNGQLWRKVVPELEARFRCIVPTLPLGAHTVPLLPTADRTPRGLARSIADFIDALDLHDVTLVGNDTGGALCQLVVAHHPERMARVVLTNCDAFENFPPPVLRPLYAAARIPGFFWALAQLLRWPPVQRAFFLTVARRAPEREMMTACFEPLRSSAGVRRDLAGAIAAVSARDTLAAVDKLARFEGPALIAWGENDIFFPLREGRRLAKVFRRATLVEIAGSRTFVPEDQPMALARSIERFIAATAAA
ncbi:MAG: alpha/beta fold hydrolase [Vulcanimicrobiaceae bacterium]